MYIKPEPDHGPEAPAAVFNNYLFKGGFHLANSVPKKFATLMQKVAARIQESQPGTSANNSKIFLSGVPKAKPEGTAPQSVFNNCVFNISFN